MNTETARFDWRIAALPALPCLRDISDYNSGRITLTKYELETLTRGLERYMKDMEKRLSQLEEKVRMLELLMENNQSNWDAQIRINKINRRP